MPIYEYECKLCGNLFEVLLFNRNDEVRCLRCKGRKVKRLISAFMVASSRSDSSRYDKDYSDSIGCSSCSSRQCSIC